MGNTNYDSYIFQNGGQIMPQATGTSPAPQATAQPGAPIPQYNAQVLFGGSVPFLDYSQVIAGSVNDPNQAALRNALYNQVQQRMNGMMPSPAQMQLAQSLEQNQKNVASQLNSAKGINRGLGARLAVQKGGEMAQEAAGQGALLRAQEQANAMNAAMGLSQLDTQRIAALQDFQARQQATQAGLASASSNTAGQIAGGLISAGGSVVGGLAAGGAFGGGGATMAPPLLSRGGRVLGNAPVPGNNEANDVVPALLSPGEIVIPRTIAEDGDMAKAFVDAINAHRGSLGGAANYMSVLEAKRMCHGGQVR